MPMRGASQAPEIPFGDNLCMVNLGDNPAAEEFSVAVKHNGLPRRHGPLGLIELGVNPVTTRPKGRGIQ